MSNTPSLADRLATTAQAARLRREVEAASRKFQRRAAIIAVVAAPVLLFTGAVVSVALNPRSTPAALTDDWRGKVSQAAPEELAKQPKLAQPTLTPQEAECVKEGLELGVVCDRYHEALGYANQVDADRASGRESYSDSLARGEQRKADLAYCAENRSDWSCSEGQYAGQY